jgi:hypothetical protein
VILVNAFWVFLTFLPCYAFAQGYQKVSSTISTIIHLAARAYSKYMGSPNNSLLGRLTLLLCIDQIFILAERADEAALCRVFHKSIYTFKNRPSSVISAPIDLKPIPVNLTGHFASTILYIILGTHEILLTLSA